ncbi:MAG: N-acetylmuramoyl-L-alanine amidase [Muribaculaceae bacterium]|nr:N-acetylmuramoyl-L-alanine amidase [Muribaculaceae bacterium]
MKLCRLFILLVVLLVVAAQASARTVASSDKRPFTIVIDPGHGGKDYGCVGKLTSEKVIVLDVARKMAAHLAKEHPEVKVVFTRDDDSFLSLQQRADVANRARGDVFVSIHVNSVDKRSRNRESVHGASVYTLGLHKNDNNLNVAMRENAVMELEPDYSAKYQGFDPSSSESYIMFELNQNSHVSNSLQLASAMQGELISTAGRADKSIRQAGFWVLWAVAMPSVLVELDFICNPAMEKFLNSTDGRDKCARALANAFGNYYARHRRDKGAPEVSAPVVSGEDSSVAADDKSGNKSEAVEDAPATYHIQFLTSGKKLPSGDSRLKGVDNVDFYLDGKMYKFFSGSFSTMDEARKALPAVRKKYAEAFIIKLQNGKRI